MKQTIRWGMMALAASVIMWGCDSVVDHNQEQPEMMNESLTMAINNSASDTVTVTENNVGDDWIPNLVGEDSGISFVSDFGAPAGLGTSALLLFTETDNSARAELATEVNVPLSEVGSMGYWTYQPDGNPALAAVAYKILVRFDDDWTFLIHEPYWQNGSGDPDPVVGGEWQYWENIQDGNWWSSRNAGGLTTGAGGPPFYSLGDVLDLNEDAVVELIQLGIGSWNPDWSVLADGMTFAGTTYNFEEILNPVTANDCKNGGWEAFGFRNQGQCIRFVNTGQDSR